MLKRMILPVLLVSLLLFALPVQAETDLDMTADSTVLMDRFSGRILYEHNAHVRRPIASTTKIVTAILALEYGDLDDVVTVSPRASVVEGSSIWLEIGEEKTLEELVYGLMLRSGNDAAAAIGEHISGSVEKFAELMTRRARELGAINSRFQNPHGLDHENHYSTAYDMALLTRHALGLEKFQEIITTEEISISWPGHEWQRILRNQNRLLSMYEGGDGVKTGWTTPAGRCFVGSATRGSSQLISVVLNAPNMWEDAIILLDYGFENYTRHSVVSKDAFIKKIPVQNGLEDFVKIAALNDYSLPLKEGEINDLSVSIHMEKPLLAPVRKGEMVGYLNISFKNEPLDSVILVAGEDVGKAGFFFRLKKNFISFISRVRSPGS